MSQKSFAEIFNTLRLKSQMETATQLADALAVEGFVYEDSIFSKWKRGTRIPRDRHVLKALITIFIKNDAIATVDEANNLLRTVDQRDLSVEEEALLFAHQQEKAPFNVPAIAPHFIERDHYAKDITWHLLNKQSVLLYGLPGTGKTTLAIKIGHFLKDHFRDGVLWYHLDKKKVDTLLNSIAYELNKDIFSVQDIELKANIVKGLIAPKDLLLILDNVEDSQIWERLFLQQPSDKYKLLFTSSRSHDTLTGFYKMNLLGFTEDEAIELTEKILGKTYVKAHCEKLQTLHRLLDYSPLAITVLLQQLSIKPHLLPKFVSQLEKSSEF